MAKKRRFVLNASPRRLVDRRRGEALRSQTLKNLRHVDLPGAVAAGLPDSITEPDIAESVKQFYEIAIPA